MALVVGLVLVGGLAAEPASAAGAATDAVAGRYIVLYERSVGDPGAATTRRERAQSFRARLRYSRAVKGFAATLTAAQVDRLRADPSVASVTEDRVVRATAQVPLAPGEPLPPTGVRRIESATATAARERSSVNVAVLDTGIDLDHPDLDAVHGRNCVTPSAPADDDHGHGTHVAGTIAARNDGAGVVGVAPGTKVFAVKVLAANGTGTISQVICGIDWVTGTLTDGIAGNDVPVVNVSLGSVGRPLRTCAATSDPMHKAICASTAAGATYVVAAGNDGWEFDHATQPDLPAAYPQVLAVTAIADTDGRPGALGLNCSTSADDAHASYSNFALTAAGAAHTIAAPGSCIRSTARGGGYSTRSGTSMASPHVAGAVALCLGEAGASGPCTGMQPAEIISRIRADAQSRSDADPGYGFHGDPLRPVQARYFGHLVSAALPAVTTDPDPVPPSPSDSPDPGPSGEQPGTGAPGGGPAAGQPVAVPSIGLPPGAAPQSTPAAAGPLKEAAKLEVRRARVLPGQRILEILAPITRRANGVIAVTFDAAGARTRFSRTVRPGSARQRITHTLPAAQARSRTGIVTLRYLGGERTRPQEIRLRAAANSARLDAERPRLDGGRLTARGTVTPRARGVVRVQLDWARAGRARRHDVNVRIRDGRWQLATPLPARLRDDIAARDGTLHSYVLFTGYAPQRIRGEMRSFEVLGAP